MKTHLLALALSAATLVACAPTVNTHGNIILPSRLAEIKPNETTQDDVVQLLGTPSTRSNFDANVWYYVTSTTQTSALKGTRVTGRKVVAVTFNPSGTVTGVKQLAENEGLALQPDPTTTRTQGQALGIVEQLMGNIGVAP